MHSVAFQIRCREVNLVVYDILVFFFIQWSCYIMGMFLKKFGTELALLVIIDDVFHFVSFLSFCFLEKW